MGADVSSIPSNIGCGLHQCFSHERESTNLTQDNVVAFDILFVKRYGDRKWHRKYVFLFQGLLALSDDLRNPHEAFQAVRRDLNLRGSGLDIRLNTNFDSLNSRTLRLWNRSSTNAESDCYDTFTPKDLIEMQNSVDDGSGGAASDRLFTGVPEHDRKSCIILRFTTEEDAVRWEKLLNIEREKVYFPADTFYAGYGVSVHALHAALMRRFERMPKNAPLRYFYYSSQLKQGTGIILSYLYHFFFSNVSDDEAHVDLPEAFINFLDMIVSNTAVAMVMLSFDYSADFLDDFHAYRMSKLQLLAASDQAMIWRDDANDDINNMAMIQLVHYVRRKVNAHAWAENRSFLAEILEYPSDESSLHTKQAVAWFARVKGGVGRFATPFSMSWTNLKLILQPTPYCAFYFLKHYTLIGDIETAREISARLPHPVITVFNGQKTSMDGINTPPRSRPSTHAKEWTGSPRLIKSPIDPALLKVAPRTDRHDQRAKKSSVLSPFSSAHDDNSPAGIKPIRTDMKAKVKELEQEEIVSAHFLSYLEWDQIQRVYESFVKENSENGSLFPLLAQAKIVYAAPLVSSASVAGQQLTSEDFAEYTVQQLHSHLGEPTANDAEKDLSLLKELCLKWMLFTSGGARGKGRALSSSQIITILTLIFWSRRVGHSLDRTDESSETRQSKSSVVQTSPTEDRSALCVLTAAFIARRMKQKVHLLYDAEEVMHADFDRLEPFLALLGVEPACNDFETDDLIAFCTKQELCKFYRYCVFRGDSPFANVVLLTPDVDELHIERDLLTVFAKRDDQLSTPLKLYFDLFLQVGDAARAPVDSVGQFVYPSWARAKMAFTQYKEMIEDEPNGFTMCEATGRVELLDEKGELLLNKNHLGLDMARYHLSGEPPLVQSTFFFQSLPYILGTHRMFIGFCRAFPTTSGDIIAEQGPIGLNRPHLWAMFGSWSFTVPEVSECHPLNIDPSASIGEVVRQISGRDLNKQEKAEDAVSSTESSSYLPWSWIDFPGIWSKESGAPADEEKMPSPGGQPEQIAEDMPAGWSAILDRGLMNGYLCEAFYRRYPYEGGKWPDKHSHRKLIEYLDSDESRTLEGASGFAVSMRLARNFAEFIHDFRRSAESFQTFGGN